jgi:hypothetical protein
MSGSKASQLQKTLGQLIVIDGSLTKLGSTGNVTLTRTPPSVNINSGEYVLTTSQLLAGIITTPGDTLLVLPSASDLVSSLPNVQIGDTFNFSVINSGIALNTVINTDTTGSIVGNSTILPLTSKTFSVRFTNVASGQQMITVYVLS